jgi:hypothetical protein
MNPFFKINFLLKEKIVKKIKNEKWVIEKDNILYK